MCRPQQPLGAESDIDPFFEDGDREGEAYGKFEVIVAFEIEPAEIVGPLIEPLGHFEKLLGDRHRSL